MELPFGVNIAKQGLDRSPHGVAKDAPAGVIAISRRMNSASGADLRTRRWTSEQRLSLETNELSPGAHGQAAVIQNLPRFLIELGDLGIEIAFGLSSGSLLLHRRS
ncbi:MAG: hypothetical protein WBF21_21685 [Steroidobacteraceae bacterium]